MKFSIVRISICPAYAGMILVSPTIANMKTYLSRVCGDDPTFAHLIKKRKEFVPRMRG